MGMLVAYLGAQEFSLPSISIHSPRRNSGTSVHVPKLHLHVGQNERKDAGEERVQYLLGVVYAKPRKCAQPSSAHLRAFSLILLFLAFFLSFSALSALLTYSVLAVVSRRTARGSEESKEWD
jgi:hypothetical protein